MAELPPVGTVVWMKTHAKPVRARLVEKNLDCRFGWTVVLLFDCGGYGDLHRRRTLYRAAFWSALDHVEGA